MQKLLFTMEAIESNSESRFKSVMMKIENRIKPILREALKDVGVKVVDIDGIIYGRGDRPGIVNALSAWIKPLITSEEESEAIIGTPKWLEIQKVEDHWEVFVMGGSGDGWSLGHIRFDNPKEAGELAQIVGTHLKLKVL